MKYTGSVKTDSFSKQQVGGNTEVAGRLIAWSRERLTELDLVRRTPEPTFLFRSSLSSAQRLWPRVGENIQSQETRRFTGLWLSLFSHGWQKSWRNYWENWSHTFLSHIHALKQTSPYNTVSFWHPFDPASKFAWWYQEIYKSEEIIFWT